MNYVWIVEEQGYKDIWWPMWDQPPFPIREEARKFMKRKKENWDWYELRVKKYVRVD